MPHEFALNMAATWARENAAGLSARQFATAVAEVALLVQKGLDSGVITTECQAASSTPLSVAAELQQEPSQRCRQCLPIAANHEQTAQVGVV